MTARRGRPRGEIGTAVLATLKSQPMATFQAAHALQVPIPRMKVMLYQLRTAGLIVEVGTFPRPGRGPVPVYGVSDRRAGATPDVFGIVWI